MAIKSILKPDGSIWMGLATVATVAIIFRNNIPNMSVVHATLPHDSNIDSGRVKATRESVLLLSVITLLTRDVNVFILGGASVVVFDFTTRHANAAHPETGKMVNPMPVSMSSVGIE